MFQLSISAGVVTSRGLRLQGQPAASAAPAWLRTTRRRPTGRTIRRLEAGDLHQPHRPTTRSTARPRSDHAGQQRLSADLSTKPICWRKWTSICAARRRRRRSSPTSTTTPRASATLIEYGNSVKTEYAYDPLDLPPDQSQNPTRLTDQAQLQDLSYTYDPAGNITQIQDDAQQTIFFRNRRCRTQHRLHLRRDLPPDQCRGARASSARQVDGCPFGPGADQSFRSTACGLLHPGDGQAMRRYQEAYEYDAVGNFLHMIHRGTDPQRAGWTRDYAV